MKRILIALLLAAPALPSQASDYPTDAELTMLPDYCTIKMKQPGTAQERAAMARFGQPNWIHMHHYCAALAHAGRAQRAATPREIAAHLRRAAGQYEYVSNGFLPGFWMRPQVLLEYGRVLVRLGQPGEAVRQFAEAVRISPGYLSAYLALIKAYRDMDMKAAALEAATAGLRQIPDAQPLQKAYLELGGSRPFPEPAATPAPGAVAADRGGETAQSQAGSEPAAERVDTSAAAELAEPVADAVPDRGCRFCPPEEIQRKWRESFGSSPQ